MFQPKNKIEYQYLFVQNKKVASNSLICPKQNWFNFDLNTFVGKWIVLHVKLQHLLFSSWVFDGFVGIC